jgi:hypothetical protein
MDVPIKANGKRGGNKKSKQNIGGPLFQDYNGKLQGAKSCSAAFWYSPYGIGGMTIYAREITASLVKEFFGVVLICVMLPQFAAAATGADPVSRAIFIGLIAGMSMFAANSWGYNDRLPRHLSPGASFAQFFSWNVNWLLLVLNLLVGFIAATCAAAILYATGSSTVPIIGGPNRTDIAGALFVQLIGTLLIAYSVLDQNTTEKGRPKVYEDRTEPEENAKGDVSNPIPNRAYQEDISKRPWLYGAVVFLIVSFCFYAFGLWTFNAYIYYAAGLAVIFINGGVSATSDPFNNIVPGVTSARIAGIAAMFILVEILAWLLAFLLDWLMYRLHNNEPGRRKTDDSSYHAVNEEFDMYDIEQSKKSSTPAKKRNVSQTVDSPISQNANYNSKLWAQ